jgi:hypothetical protein
LAGLLDETGSERVMRSIAFKIGCPRERKFVRKKEEKSCRRVGRQISAPKKMAAAKERRGPRAKQI